MILSKVGRLSLLAGLLCLLLMGFTGAANAVIRWDVFPSPSEVINSGRSEVLGSVTLVVNPQNTLPIVTGNIAGGPTQLGILYNNRIMVDNNFTATGIKLFTNNIALNSALCVTACNPNTQFFLTVVNTDITGAGQFSGQVTINIPGGVTMNVGDVIRVDGVRGRIDKSDLSTPGTDGFAQLQSINDPAGNQFFPDTVRVAKSFIPMTVSVTADTATLCLPSFGKTGNAFLTQNIKVTENFVRAFVAKDSNGAGPDSTDRLDSFQQILGSPSNGTMLRIFLNGIPASVASVSWPTPVAASTGGFFDLVVSSSSAVGFTAGTAGGPANGTAFATYEYKTLNQAGASDATLENFLFTPVLFLSTVNQQDVGIVRAGVSLWPPPATGEPTTGVYAPYSTNSYPFGSNNNNVGTNGNGPSMPRFATNYISGSVSDTNPTGTVATTQFGIYENFAPCVCYLLYPYTTKDGFFDTGIVVANTSDDSGAIGTAFSASRQAGTVTFWLYDFRLGNVTPAAGIFFADATHLAPPGQSGPAFDANTQPIYYAGQSVRGLVSQLVTGSVATTLANKGFTDFAGYIIAKAQFQFCHGFAFIADKTFSTIAQGYVAGVIPDPSVKGLKRTASAAADVSGANFGGLPAGESINN